MHWAPRRLAVLAVACVVLSFLVWTDPVQAQIYSCGTTSLGTYGWQASGQLTRSNNCQGFRGFRCYPVENPSWSVDKTDPACDPEAGSCVVEIHARATVPGLKDMIVEETRSLRGRSLGGESPPPSAAYSSSYWRVRSLSTFAG